MSLNFLTYQLNSSISLSRSFVFQVAGRFHWWSLYSRVLGKGLHKVKSYGISGQIFGLISCFLSNRRLQRFWMGSLHYNIQLMLELIKALLLVLHFSYYTLMSFLMILSVELLSMLMIILSVLGVIRHLICGNI